MFSFMANNLGHFYKNFQGFTYCSVFKVLRCRLSDSSFTISQLISLVNNYFKVFFEPLSCHERRFLKSVSLFLKDKAYLSTTVNKSQHLFVEIFRIVLTAYTILKNPLFHAHNAQKITTSGAGSFRNLHLILIVLLKL